MRPTANQAAKAFERAVVEQGGGQGRHSLEKLIKADLTQVLGLALEAGVAPVKFLY